MPAMPLKKGKGAAGKKSAGRVEKKSAGRVEKYSDDEIDAFHAQREKILLGGNEEDSYEDEAFDEAVMNLPSDEEDEEEEEGWGKSRKTYYAADAADEDLKDEAAEARRLQKKQLAALQDEDFGTDGGFGKRMVGKSRIVSLELSDDDEVADASEAEDRFVSESELAELDGARLEAILPEEEKLALIEKHAPELRSFLAEFRGRIAEIRGTLEPVLERMRGSTDKGLCYLETKHQLLIGYCANLAYYLLLKVQGKGIADHPVIARLVKYRLLIEKIKPMEAKLQYQIDKLLHAAGKGADKKADDEDVALAFRPNLDMVQASDSDEGSAEEKSAVYKAPKVAPVHFVDGKKSKKDEDREKLLASRSRLLTDVQAEMEDRPEEDYIDPVYGRSKTSSSSKHRQEYEEDNFVRFTLTRDEQRKLKRAESRPIDELEDLNDFFKETAGGGKTKGSGKSAIDRLLGIKSAKAKSAGGDDDVPAKRSKRHGGSQRVEEEEAQSEMSEIEDDMDGEDDYYKSAKQRAQAKKGGQSGGAVAYKPIRDGTAGAARPATYAMLKNKGLTPSRSKETRNPRVRQRAKWERAQKKIKSFKPVVQQQNAPYRGESTGIRTNLARSVKF